MESSNGLELAIFHFCEPMIQMLKNVRNACLYWKIMIQSGQHFAYAMTIELL